MLVLGSDELGLVSGALTKADPDFICFPPCSSVLFLFSPTREPGNHDNGASDVWTLTAYIQEKY